MQFTAKAKGLHLPTNLVLLSFPSDNLIHIYVWLTSTVLTSCTSCRSFMQYMRAACMLATVLGSLHVGGAHKCTLKRCSPAWG